MVASRAELLAPAIGTDSSGLFIGASRSQPWLVWSWPNHRTLPLHAWRRSWRSWLRLPRPERFAFCA
jgi:hypothetical protein